MRPASLCIGVAAMVGLAAGCASEESEDAIPPEFSELVEELEKLGPISLPVQDLDDDELVAMFDPQASSNPSDRSAIDGVSEEFTSDMSDSERAMLALLPDASAFGEFRLLSVLIDDPNGDGTIGDRWYEPRVKRNECSASIDNAPIPTVAAVYLPGMQDNLIGETEITDGFEALRSPVSFSIQLQIFDTAEQRNGERDALLDFLRDPSFRCGDNPSISITNSVERAPLQRAQPGAVFENGAFLSPAPTAQGIYWVNDRVLATISTTTIAAEAGWDDATLELWLGAAIDATLNQLANTPLPSLPT